MRERIPCGSCGARGRLPVVEIRTFGLAEMSVPAVPCENICYIA